jgi:hypothetical protein
LMQPTPCLLELFDLIFPFPACLSAILLVSCGWPTILKSDHLRSRCSIDWKWMMAWFVSLWAGWDVLFCQNLDGTGSSAGHPGTSRTL